MKNQHRQRFRNRHTQARQGSFHSRIRSRECAPLDIYGVSAGQGEVGGQNAFRPPRYPSRVLALVSPATDPFDQQYQRANLTAILSGAPPFVFLKGGIPRSSPAWDFSLTPEVPSSIGCTEDPHHPPFSQSARKGWNPA